MLDVIEKLLALQDRDQRLKAFQTELTHIPEERKSREKQIADSAARLEESRTRVKQIEVEKRNLETEAQAKRDGIARYKQQQLQTRKNEEYSALAHEIETAEKVIRTIEDQELELMDEAEKLKPAVAEAEKVHAAEKEKIEQILTGLTDKKTNLDARVSEIKSDRTRLSEGIDEDVLELYERLFKTKQGTVVVPLEHDVCMGCHMKVTSQTSVLLKAQKDIVHCPQCGRMLYIPA